MSLYNNVSGYHWNTCTKIFCLSFSKLLLINKARSTLHMGVIKGGSISTFIMINGQIRHACFLTRFILFSFLYLFDYFELVHFTCIAYMCFMLRLG